MGSGLPSFFLGRPEADSTTTRNMTHARKRVFIIIIIIFSILPSCPSAEAVVLPKASKLHGWTRGWEAGVDSNYGADRGGGRSEARIKTWTTKTKRKVYITFI